MKAVSRDADGRCWLRHVQPPLMKRGASVPPGQQSAADELGCFPAADKKEKKAACGDAFFGVRNLALISPSLLVQRRAWGGLFSGLSVG